MRKFAVAAALVMSSGCSTLFLPGAYGPHFAPPSRTHVDPSAAAMGRWDQVMRLPRAATIDVLTRDGLARLGRFAAADEESVRVEIQAVEVRIPRRDIVRVDLVDLPGHDGVAVARGAAGGALLGAGAAALFSAVLGGDGWPPPGTLLRAGAAYGGWFGGEAAIQKRRGRPIYIKPHP